VVVGGRGAAVKAFLWFGNELKNNRTRRIKWKKITIKKSNEKREEPVTQNLF
jgi:hypothetical protein